MITLPKTNSSHLQNGWLEYDCFLLGRLGLISGANWLFVSGRVDFLKNLASEIILFLGFLEGMTTVSDVIDRGRGV